ncbi:lethal(2) giant larvae protein [Toxorhynchites rutilus septentrionalis]|uniref:lethal(2) giant larvae protein n=1 Tax=Toxorhynchites rutilus septentrionalis TaxID=329112 RepID=UPI00247A345E|nr:lethal(2) giant larvae protein [Toxorhynchites rutilus septentrionalis]XP_055618101.1 lethal(2) giant larvae protein [Toxorhynchites rutilus septentrionalis]XP_055618102.1 lethal(2) giant larvae protein [Toxorhynchites rutilus septentrionalis]XP_055618103.1 lethal(2) giant larvae protein [Toxorhynchites rutilus septentrionalis]XP_055618104.1 lethal(2) giant larvae protein [Toxorhynchites rutilus septentrionalis]XP_055618105.1 lethal(2) giant larvae protein [Toxorhynchites rutilus septentrio
MLKFIRGKGQQPSAERQKLQKELFAFRRTAQHGFPHKPSALAYDPTSKLMAIGTNSGIIKVFGKPGVEFYGQHPATTNASDSIVQLLEWIPGSGRLLSLTASNQLILWEPAGAMLVPIKTLPFDGKLKKISSLCCSYMTDTVWIGTEGGNVYQFDIKSFSVREPVIYHDVVLEQLPQSYKLNPGAIESVKQLPHNHNQLLIAYNRGLVVLWDLEASNVKQSFISPGHGQSVGLFISPCGTQFTWYHADGSFATWDLDSPIPPENQKYVPYGPDPCKAIDRLIRGKRGLCELVVFSGGMPRSAYGEHQCVSVHCRDGTKVAFDFTSKVIDFFVTFNDERPEQVEVLVVLLEEELVAYDLTDETLPQINAPYLHSLHASAVTCNHLVSQLSPEIYEQIMRAGKAQLTDFSVKSWPITGGTIPEADEEERTEYDIMITGHEDGSVKFWNCSEVCLTPLLHVKTAPLFNNSDDFDNHLNNSTEQLDDGEPPFRKAGQFDPYSDDPRLAVKKVQLCPKTGTLVIAGTAGNVVVANFAGTSEESSPLKVTTMNLVSDRDGFIWKGHDQLKVKRQLLEDNQQILEGVNFTGVLQILPPAAVTCIAVQSQWNLVAAGTAHGLVLYDYLSQSPVLHKCTLNPNDLTGAGETLSRRKSFKKTLRESFRRLRKGRSTRNNRTNQTTAVTTETRPVERQIEARPVDDGMGSMVRCLTFAQTYVTNQQHTIPTLWSGTNSSCVSVFVLHVPPRQPPVQSNEAAVDGDVPPPKPITGQLAKEIQLKHRAPVIAIAVFDQHGVPLEFQSTPGPGPHKVLIASEEQFKVFSLPQLKPVNKYKLTAHEGARVRRIAFATFSCTVPAHQLQPSPTKSLAKSPSVAGTAPASASPSAEALNTSTNDTTTPSTLPELQKYTEISLLCLTNLGDCLVLSIPELRRQLNAAAVRREDINGISSLCFTNHGEALYMMSSSEVQRITLSTAKIVSPTGFVDLEDWSHAERNDDDTGPDTEEPVTPADDTPPAATAAEGATGVGAKENPIDFTTPLSVAVVSAVNGTGGGGDGLTNGTSSSGDEASPNKANETITSSIGDITIDSVRDHLNSTTTTLCSTTTEEIVGRLSVLSTHSNNVASSAKATEITSLNSSNIKDLKLVGDSTETASNSVIIKSVITTVKHGIGHVNGEHSTTTTTESSKTITSGGAGGGAGLLRKESQF